MPDNHSITWYINRLAAMSFDEVLLRLKRKLAEPFVNKAIKNEKLPCSIAEILSSANTFIGCPPIDTDKI